MSIPLRDESDLRCLLERRLKRRISDAIWDRLCEDGRVEEALSGHANGSTVWRDEFEADLRREEEYARQLQKKPSAAASRPQESRGGGGSDLRSEAWRTITADEAAGREAGDLRPAAAGPRARGQEEAGGLLPPE